MSPKKSAEGSIIDKMLADGDLMRGDDERLVIQRIPIGLPQLDEITNGGIPRHRITIFTGQYSCVAPETLIETEIGPVPIKTIVEDKLSLRVWSFNTRTSEWQLKPIIGWWKQSQYAGFIRIGRLHLTPHHEIWTSRGYVEAKEIKRFPADYSIIAAEGKNVKGLLQPLPAAINQYRPSAGLPTFENIYRMHRLQDPQKVQRIPTLLQLRGQVASQKSPWLYRESVNVRNSCETTRIISPNYEQSRQSSLGKLEWRTPGHKSILGESCTPQNASDGTWLSLAVAEQALDSFGGTLAQRVCGSDGPWSEGANQLQNRYCPSSIENRYRSRQLAQSEEDQMVQQEWMDATSFLQQNGRGVDGGLSRDSYVYDLTVAENHNFIADNILVSNSGKTLMLQILMKNAIEQGLQVAYIDTEQSYDPIWWKTIGLPPEKFLVSQPIIGEAAVDTAVALVKAGVDIVAIDSLAALVPHEETEEDAKKKFIGLQARLIGKLMRLLLSAKHNSAIVCTNQVRDAIGGPVPFDIMPGGVAQGFFSSLIIRTQRVGWIEEKEERIGFNIRVIVRKSKVGQPFKECTLPFLFRGEIDVLSLLVDRGIESGLIGQKGAWYTLNFGGLQGETIMGRNNLLARLADEPELQKHLAGSLGEIAMKGEGDE